MEYYMQEEMVLQKLVELSAIQYRDSKTRRFFILADGKRTFDQLCELCGFDRSQGEVIAEMLLSDGVVGFAPAPPSDQEQRLVVTEKMIEQLLSEIVNHIGPVANIFVKKSISAGSSLTKTQLDNITANLADHIETQGDRRVFLKKARDIFSDY